MRDFPAKDWREVLRSSPSEHFPIRKTRYLACGKRQSNQLGQSQILLDARVKYAESYRVGAGAVPLLTDSGWLEIYHSADRRDRYHLTAMVFAKDDPTKVIMKSKRPLIFPTEEYEKNGFKENVVFTCGLIRKTTFCTSITAPPTSGSPARRFLWRRFWKIWRFYDEKCRKTVFAVIILLFCWSSPLAGATARASESPLTLRIRTVTTNFSTTLQPRRE